MWKKSGLIILHLALTGCANTVGDSVKDTAGITQSLPNGTEDGENSVGKQMDIYEEDGLRLELVSETDGAGNIVPESVRLKIENSMDDECMIRSIGTAVNIVTIGNSLTYAEIEGNDSTEEDIMLSKLEMGSLHRDLLEFEKEFCNIKECESEDVYNNLRAKKIECEGSSETVTVKSGGFNL